MAETTDEWTQAHSQALIYIALAYGSDHDLSDEELDTITERLRKRYGGELEQDVQEVVMEAMSVYLEDQTADETIQAMRSLKRSLSSEERSRALEDVVQIAEADGVLLSSERSLISTLSEIWSLNATGEDMLDKSTATTKEHPSWTLLNDISLMYVVMAHSTDNELSEGEIDAMIDRLQEWQPDEGEERVRETIRDTLAYYSEEPREEELRASVQAVKEALPVIQRLTVLDDLAHIAEADGTFNQHERDMISMLSQAWDIGVRIDDEVPSNGTE
jgi:uncharacterized tellurite resistance protein B-like protein